MNAPNYLIYFQSFEFIAIPIRKCIYFSISSYNVWKYLLIIGLSFCGRLYIYQHLLAKENEENAFKHLENMLQNQKLIYLSFSTSKYFENWDNFLYGVPLVFFSNFLWLYPHIGSVLKKNNFRLIYLLATYPNTII